MNDWFENEAFWVQYAPIMFDTSRWKEAPAVAEGIFKLAGVDRPPQELKIFDAGCGLGRIAVELAILGAQVQADLREFIRPASFDIAVNMYTSFGYCKTIEEDALIIRNIAQSLKKDGCFILEMLGREVAVRDFTAGEWFERAGYTVLTDFTVEGAWEGLRSHWQLYSKDGLKADHTFVQRLYAATELRQLMLLSGFHSVEIYGDFDRSPYNERARTMILVGRK